MKGLAAEHFLQTPFTHVVRSGAKSDHWACRRAAWVFCSSLELGGARIKSSARLPKMSCQLRGF